MDTFLIIYLTCLGLNIIGIIFDYVLYTKFNQSITTYARNNRWLEMILITWQVLQTVALMWHIGPPVVPINN